MNKTKTWLCVVLAASFAATALAQETAQQAPAKDKDGKPCNNVAAAVGGALLGALLGGKKHRVAGAAVGGAIGAVACTAVNYRAQQVKTAQQVNDDFSNSHGGALPAKATLVRFETRFDPSSQIQPGGTSTLSSYIEVAGGTDGVAPVVEEEIVLMSPGGEPLKTVRKPASSSASAGAFKTQFALTLPQGVQQGVYPVKASLYLNGERVGQDSVQLQVAQTADGAMTLALAR